MIARLEHANLNVQNIDGVVRFLTTAFPEFEIRHDSAGIDGPRWVHVGTNETYLALYQAQPGLTDRQASPASEVGLNHLACEVDDVETVRGRLVEGGFEEHAFPNAHPYRRRIYFADPEGNEWEFVQYLSCNPGERNDYRLPDR